MPYVDYSTLKWDDLINQAKQDHQKQWDSKDSFDPFSSGTTNIGGNNAQIYLDQSASQNDPDWWKNTTFNFNNPDDPNQPEKNMTKLTRGPDGGVKVDYYRQENGVPMGALAVLAAPFAVAGLQSVGILGSSAPAWTSGYDLAGGAALPTGATAAAEAAPWVSGYDLAGGAALPTGGGLTWDKAAKFIGKQAMKEMVRNIIAPGSSPQRAAMGDAGGPSTQLAPSSYIKPPSIGGLQQVQQTQIPIMQHAFGNTNLVKPTLDWEDFQ